MGPIHLTSRKRTTALDCLTAPDNESGKYFTHSTDIDLFFTFSGKVALETYTGGGDDSSLD